MIYNKLQRNPGARSGFTLLEVLVAMVLLSIALVAIFELFSADLRGIAKSDDVSNAAMLAESRIREVLDEDNLAEKTWTETTEDGYRINTVVRSTADDRTQNLQIKLLEINLTVSWIKDSKERSLNLKTLKMVNKPI